MHGTSHRREIGTDRTREVATIEILRPRLRDAFEGCREAWLAENVATSGHGPTRGVDIGKAGRRPHLGKLVGRVGDLALCHRDAVACVSDGIGQQPRERELAAQTSRYLLGGTPARHRARDRDRRERPARRHRIETLLAVARDRRAAARGPAGVDGDRSAIRRRNHPEPVTADRIHVRIDDCDGRRRGDHRLDRIAALAQDGQAGLGGEMMRGDHHSVGREGRVQHGSGNP